MEKHQISLFLPMALKEEIDKARGLVSLAAWVREACREKVAKDGK